MSGRVGLREESRQAHLLAQRIAQLFPLPEGRAVLRSAAPEARAGQVR